MKNQLLLLIIGLLYNGISINPSLANSDYSAPAPRTSPTPRPILTDKEEKCRLNTFHKCVDKAHWGHGCACTKAGNCLSIRELDQDRSYQECMRQCEDDSWASAKICQFL